MTLGYISLFLVPPRASSHTRSHDHHCSLSLAPPRLCPSARHPIDPLALLTRDSAPLSRVLPWSSSPYAVSSTLGHVCLLARHSQLKKFKLVFLGEQSVGKVRPVSSCLPLSLLSAAVGVEV